MAATWNAEQLEQVHRAPELEITTRRADGTLREWVPIWVVRVGDEVYVRTWHRRDTGWFGHAVTNAAARVRVPGLEAVVVVEDVGTGPAGLRAEVDAAYVAKYAGGARSMVTDESVAATLRLSPA